MISLGTAVFYKIIEDQRRAGFSAARKVGIKALTDTLKETSRFSTFEEGYVKECAADRFDLYAQNPEATPTNQVIPKSKGTVMLPRS